MKKLIMSFCALIMMMSASEVSGQDLWNNITTKSEKITPQQFVEKSYSFEKEILGNDYVVVISFENIPSKQQLADLQNSGIELLNYHSKSAYLAKVPTRIKSDELEKIGITSLRKYTANEKLSPEIKSGQIPSWAVNSPGKVDVAIILNDATKTARTLFSQKFKIEILEVLAKGAILIGRVDESQLAQLVESPLVKHLDAIEPPAETLMQENRSHQRANVLQASFAGQRNLQGEGVTVGIGDGGELGNHIDFDGRVINYANGTYSSFGSHGDHVAGIVGGAGNINPIHRGMAPKVELIIQKTTSIINNSYTYFDDHEMVMTNNSYGVGYNCESNGTYNYSSLNLDKQMRDMPEMLHVYAAGNSGYSQCGNYPAGYKSVLRYYQSAKNVLTVGNAKEDRTLNGGSSKGPVEDGRIKPEIVGIGSNVYSTGNDNNYYAGTGTSMAAPSVMGNLVLINERYRQLNGGQKPNGGLVKALVCNTADDLGNVGPDYAYGFGLINSRRAVECLENNQYISDEILNSESKTYNIDVPVGVGQLKVMLYWVDKEAQAYASKTLVNDLDLKLTTPDGTDFLPWVLNPDTLHVLDLPTRKVDTLNNIEQVTIDNPSTGTYTITIEGTNIPTNDQGFFITYDFVKTDVLLTYPYGAETFEPSTVQVLQWDTDVNNSSDFTIEYSIDGGDNWSVISSAISSEVRHHFWSVPNVTTEDGVIRITKNGNSDSHQNILPFTIIQKPTNLIATSICDGYMNLAWDENPEIASYQIFKLSGSEMVVIDTVTTNNYVTEELVVGESYWYAVRGLTPNGGKTQRSVASQLVPEAGGECPWDFDVNLQNILANDIGRAGTQLALTTTEPIALEIINVGSNDIDSFEIKYQLNNGDMVSEIIHETILSGDTLNQAFSVTADFASSGNYILDAYLVLDFDTDMSNNEIVGTYEVQQLPNEPIELPYIEDFENISTSTISNEVIGLAGIEAWDFEPDANGGSQLLLVNEGTNKCLETSGFLHNSTDEGIRITLNMNNYIGSEDVFINFDYKYVLPNIIGSSDSIFIRGSDYDEWISIYELFIEDNWTASGDLDVSSFLTANGQAFSSSFQIHFSQGKNTGYAIDNFEVYSLSSLPVELSSFTAEKKDNNALLKWVTTTEYNNEKFEIEVSDEPLLTNDDSFERIGTVAGNGTTTTNQFYTYLDQSSNKSGIRYYRLKQINFDGTFAYSDIRAVEFEERPHLTFYPNPFINKIQVDYDEEDLQITRIQVYNSTGEKVYETQTSNQNESVIVNIKDRLPSGMYYLKLITDTETLTYPILKSEK